MTAVALPSPSAVDGVVSTDLAARTLVVRLSELAGGYARLLWRQGHQALVSDIRSCAVARFPSLSGAELMRFLAKLGYKVQRVNGSHHILAAPDRPGLVFAYHKGQTFPPGLVRKILVKDVGLSEAEALELVS